MNLIDKKILLVGGAGFIGHHLALQLSQHGADVTIADAFSVNNFINLETNHSLSHDLIPYKGFISERLRLLKEKDIKFEILDARDKFSLSQLLERQFDVVYLLAAVSHASRSNTDPINALNHGLVPFTNLVTLLADRPETRLVYLSSSTVYGNFTKSIVDETDLCAPFGMYAVLKHCGEKILNETALHSNLNYSVVRPSALYGERCISRRVSQIFLENAFAGRPLIFRGDVSERLDFTYILDLCEGLMLAGTKPAAKSEVFNITRGASRPVVDLVEILRDYFPGLKFKIEDRDQATPKRGTLSNTKALNLLGFKPKYDVDVAYRTYIEWYINRAKTETMRFNNVSQVNE